MADPAPRTYHGQPVLKKPVWTWEIPVYFYFGGVAGAGAGLACLSGLRGNDVLAKRAWAVSLAAAGVSPVLLSSDLGRPERALNMFRMFKVTSPMSVGSWVLLGAGSSIGLSAVNAWLGWFPRAARASRPAAALLGLPLSTYTGALLADTSVPAWHEARDVLPHLFGSGAALSAGAAATALTPVADAAPARRLALGAAAVELGLKELMQRRLGEAGEPYTQGSAERFGNLSRACVAAGAALLAWRGSSSRRAAVAGGALMSAGALALRWSVFQAGAQSAADPKSVIGPQRARVQRGERRGGARKQARVEAGDPALGSPATAVWQASP